MPDAQTKLAALYDHHRDHGPSSAFINVNVDGETILQFVHNGADSPDIFNGATLLATLDDPDEVTTYAEQSPHVEPQDAVVGEGTDIAVVGDEDTDALIDISEELLGLCDYTLDDVTFAEEVSCPNNGRMTWDHAIGNTDQKPVHDTPNVKQRVRAVYEHLQALANDAEEVPDPFPTVHFYVDQERLPFVVGPNVYSVDVADDELQAEFETFINGYEDCKVTANDPSGVSATAYTWTPDGALDVTLDVFDTLLDADVEDVTYVEVVQGEETRGWDRV